MSRDDHRRHDRELEQERHHVASEPVPIMRRVVLILQRKWKQLLLFLGVQSLLDVVKEFLRGKLMDRAFEYLGPLGQWLKAYPVAFFTIGLVIAMVVLIVA